MSQTVQEHGTTVQLQVVWKLTVELNSVQRLILINSHGAVNYCTHLAPVQQLIYVS